VLIGTVATFTVGLVASWFQGPADRGRLKGED
jgi:hypothetical protein